MVFFNPEWVNEWLANPRNIRLRGMASIVPRTFSYFNLHPIIFWLFLILITICLIYWLFKKELLNLDMMVLLSFIVLPFLHDYDLTQLIPLLDDKKRRIWGLTSSIPLWFTICFAYNNDHFWYTATLISPILVYYLMTEGNNSNSIKRVYKTI